MADTTLNQGFSGGGFGLFEHWEGDHLLLIASTPEGMFLQPGGTILSRRWAASTTVYDFSPRERDLPEASHD